MLTGVKSGSLHYEANVLLADYNESHGRIPEKLHICIVMKTGLADSSFAHI